jgi:hypothetical protein
MEEIAKNVGYETKVLLTAAATREAVVKHIQRAAKELSDGDIFLLTYSGHGGQLPDKNHDERDMEDETWCLYDGQLIDDELYLLWSQFKEGVRIFLLSDSCHSGTVAKQYARSMAVPDSFVDALNAKSDIPYRGPVYRMMPPEYCVRTYVDNRSYYDGIISKIPPKSDMGPVNSSVLLISGCQDNQFSMDGTFNGAFTGTLKSVWNDGQFSGHYGEFHQAIVSLMPATQSPNLFIVGKPNREFLMQKPFKI